MPAAKDELLKRIQHAARYGTIHTRRHARERMSERGATAEDVKKALLSATTAIDQPKEGTVRLEGGCDTDGDALIVVVAEQHDGLRVVTVI